MGQAKSWGRVQRDVLLAAPLPQATKTYTVISHGFVINTIKQKLAEKGFTVTNEIYSATDGANVAIGIFHINYGDDPELGMLFAFANSYDKSMKFRCSVGAYVKKNEASILSEAGSAWIRMHTGNADQEAADTIQQQIDDAEGYFKQLVVDKSNMMNVKLSRTEFAELLGRLYVDDKIIANGQLNLAAREYEKPSFNYVEPDSLWTMYNHILVGLAKSHPTKWMKQQKLVHLHLMTNYDFTVFDDEIVDPNQMTIMDQIADQEDKPDIPSQEEINEGNFPEEAAEVLTDEDIEEAPDVRYVDPVELPDTRMMTKREIVEEFGDILPPEKLKALGVEVKEEEVPVQTEIPVAEEETAPEPPAPAPAEPKVKPSIKMKDAIEIYGHLITEEQKASLLSGNRDEEAINILKAAYLADNPEKEEEEKVSEAEEVKEVEEVKDLDQEEDEDWEKLEKAGAIKPVVETDAEYAERVAEIEGEPEPEMSEEVHVANEEEAEKIIREELQKDGIELEVVESISVKLPPMPSDEEVETVDAVEVSEVNDSEQFSMSVEDVVGLCPSGIVPEEGMVITIGDDECEVIAVNDDQVTLAPLNLEEEVVVDQVRDDHNAESQPPVDSKPIGEDFDSTPETIVDMDFEIGEPTEMAPVEGMLATKSQSVESLEEPAEEPAEELSDDAKKALEVMEAKKEMTPEEKELHDLISKEIEDIYGELYPFTYKLNGDQYSVTLESGEVMILKTDYIESLKADA